MKVAHLPVCLLPPLARDVSHFSLPVGRVRSCEPQKTGCRCSYKSELPCISMEDALSQLVAMLTWQCPLQGGHCLSPAAEHLFLIARGALPFKGEVL